LEDVFYGSPQAHKKPPKWVTHKGVALTQAHPHTHQGNEINKAAERLSNLSGARKTGIE